MGAAFIGMDTGAIRQLAVQMDAAADAVEQAMAKLTSQLGTAEWAGADARKFREEWQNQHCQQLRTVAQSLKNAAITARQNAEAQDTTSA